MKFFATLTIVSVNAAKCWVGEGETVSEFQSNANKVTCGENELCQMTVRKRAGVVKKVIGKCKQDRACKTNSRQNFRGGEPLNYQCRPEATVDEEGASIVSVCRSCSDTPWEQYNSASFLTEAQWQRNLLW